MNDADDPGAPSPQMIASVVCDACSTGFVTGRCAAAQPVPPTSLAGEWAARDGWRANTEAYVTGWRCPRCLGRYGETGGPRRYTIREVWFIHRRLRGMSKPT